MISAQRDLLLLLLADARLPVGGHTQSAQLEPAIADGLGPADIPEFIAARLAAVVRVEAGTAVAARAAAAAGEDVATVERAWAARTVSPAAREVSRAQGRALVRLAGALWPHTTPRLHGLPRPSRPTVLGVVAGAVGVDALGLARLVAYDDVQTVCAAALKLCPLDPLAVAGWVRDALPAVEAAARSVHAVSRPADIPAIASPQIEAWAQAHAHSTRRLFRA